MKEKLKAPILSRGNNYYYRFGSFPVKFFLCVYQKNKMLSVRFLSTFFMKYYIISKILYYVSKYDF